MQDPKRDPMQDDSTPENSSENKPSNARAPRGSSRGSSRSSSRSSSRRASDARDADLGADDNNLHSQNFTGAGAHNGLSGVGGIVSKATSLQNYHLLAFRKAIHPEFFGIEGRQRVQHADYETEAWIFRGGHSLRFQLNGFCMTEVVVEHIDQIPDRGLIAALPCAGERDFEEKIVDNIVYMTTMQTETLSDHLYLGTYKEMMAHARENNSLFAAWTDGSGKANLSLIDVQHFRTEVHIQGFHLRADCGLVLRTQSMVQIVTPKLTKDGKKIEAKKPEGRKSDGKRSESKRGSSRSSGTTEPRN